MYRDNCFCGKHIWETAHFRELEEETEELNKKIDAIVQKRQYEEAQARRCDIASSMAFSSSNDPKAFFSVFSIFKVLSEIIF